MMIASMKAAGSRIARRDVVITLVMTVLGLLLMYDNVWGGIADAVESSDPEAKSAVHIGNLMPRELAFVLFPLVTVPLLWRRVAPLQAAGAAYCGLLVNIALLGTEFLRCGVVLPTGMLFAFAAASRLDGREAWAGLALSVGMPATDMFLTFDPVTASAMTGATVVVWGIGRVVRSRGRLVDELEERTADLRVARDERARLEVATDRARLSGELDELLHRRLGALARLAGDASTSDARTATATLVDIERESRRTLEEMRGLVGVLREDDSAPGTEPQPTVTHLEALLTQANGAGGRVVIEGNPRVLPPAIELSVYRIVEHLLEAMPNSPDVEVQVRFGDDAIDLTVSGPARRRSQAAMERARERVRLHHGTLDTSTREGRAAAMVRLPVLVEV
jgi:signal transduction histidine kinase